MKDKLNHSLLKFSILKRVLMPQRVSELQLLEMIQHAPLFDSKNGRKRLNPLYTVKHLTMAKENYFQT